MPLFRLHHRHEADQCPVAFAAWKGCDSPLRLKTVIAGCSWGHHQMWWDVEALDSSSALALLPRYVSERTVAMRVEERNLQ